MNQTEALILSVIDEKTPEIIRFANDIFRHAEEGFCETSTAEKVAAILESLDLKPERGLALTGVKARLGEKSAPTLALIGELDGIRCPDHPLAVPETGMSHACGHHMQLAALIGAAFALHEVQDSLDGNVVFFAVPAEEYTAIDKTQKLIQEGKLNACCGKSELIYTGAFDDIDLTFTTHAHMVSCGSDFLLGNNSANGFFAKSVHMLGKASHAAIAPQDGVNALDAATLGLTALGMLRSTFEEKDYVRVHPVVRGGTGAVNVVPSDVLVEMQVRGKTMDAIRRANEKVTRAFEAGAHAFGAKAQITDGQGFLPVIASEPCPALLSAAELLKGEASCESVDLHRHNVASTDVGDLTHIMPVVNFTMGGFTGALHSADFQVTDENKAYILPAKMMALTAYHLLKDGAVQAKTLVDEYKPVFTRKDYQSYVKSFK